MTLASAGEPRRQVAVVMSLGEPGPGVSAVHGVGRVRLVAAEHAFEDFYLGEWRAFVVRIPEAMVAAEPSELRRVAGQGDLSAYRALTGPMIERLWSARQASGPEPLFSDEVWWARGISALVARVTSTHPTPQTVARARRSQVDWIVSRYSGDRRLTPASIAAAIGVSRRTLYEIAEPQFGGVSEFIRAARAMHAARMLADASLRHLSVGEIAAATGFSSARHLSRALLAFNGLSPADLRPEPAVGLETA